MIAKLRGLLDQTGPDWAVVDVGGVGYHAFCSARTLDALGGPGEAVTLWIETHVREDHIHLYGFATPEERDWFRLLTKVQGVGARVALAVLGAIPVDRLIEAVAAQDRTALTRAEGVGPKLAARIVNELKDKIGDPLIAATTAAGARTGGDGPAAESGAAADAVSALVNLGYRRVEAYGAVAEAARRIGPDASVEGLIKAGLQELGA